MRETHRDQQHPPVLKAQLLSDPLAKSRRSFANITRNIEKPSAPTAHPLGLRLGQCLEMRATRGVNRAGKGMIILNKFRFYAFCSKAVDTVCFRKKLR